MSILDVRDLSVSFEGDDGRVEAVKGASFSVPAGRTVALVGESGSGKTVISQTIMGLLPNNAFVTGGEVLFRPDGQSTPYDLAQINRDSDEMRTIRGNRISIVFQEPMTALSPLHTIGDQLGETVRNHQGRSRSEAREITQEMLRLVQFPNPKQALDTYPFELSGGLRQRAMIAMALMCRPSLLVADEPTTALDVTIQAEILKLIKDVQQELHMAVLLITHDFGVVANMADDVVVIYHGRIMESGTADTIFRTPQHPYLKALLNAVPRFDMADDDRLQPIRPIEPVTSDKFKPTETVEPGEPVIKIEKASRLYPLRKGGLLSFKPQTLRAVDAVSLTVKAGECLGLVGQSGSGKTTVSKMILGAEPVDEGAIEVRFENQMREVASLNSQERQRFRQMIQFIFQDPFSSLNPRMTVFEILSEPFVIHNIGTKEERAERIRALMTMVGLDHRFLRRYPHSFSGGQRQRIGIARALALSPQILLCDEPVSALDVSVQAQVLNLLKDLKQQLGLTYVFVSHNMAVVDYIADRIAVMCAGRLVELADRESIINNPRHPYTQALLEAIPQPSLDHPLDFEKLDQMGASNPETWPDPFRLIKGSTPQLFEAAPGHFICQPA